MKKYITNYAPEEKLEVVISLLDQAIDAWKEYVESILPEDKNKLVTMATSREGIVEVVSTIATNNEQVLPREDKAEDLAIPLAYQKKLKLMLGKAKKLEEMLADTKFLNGVDIMSVYKKILGSLQNARESNGNLDEEMKEVDVWHERFGNLPDSDVDQPVNNPPTPPTV